MRARAREREKSRNLSFLPSIRTLSENDEVRFDELRGGIAPFRDLALCLEPRPAFVRQRKRGPDEAIGRIPVGLQRPVNGRIDLGERGRKLDTAFCTYLRREQERARARARMSERAREERKK